MAFRFHRDQRGLKRLHGLRSSGEGVIKALSSHRGDKRRPFQKKIGNLGTHPAQSNAKTGEGGAPEDGDDPQVKI